MDFDKIIFILENKLAFLSNEELAIRCLDENILISTLAIKRLVKRNPVDILVDDNLLTKIIDKMTIEQIWFLASSKTGTKLAILCSKKLSCILEYYDQMFEKETIKGKLKLIK